MSRTQEQWAHLRGRRFRKARRNFLTENPLCKYCEQLGHVTAATVVDHIIPHKGDVGLFWDEENWAALCDPCHNSVKQRLEITGKMVGCDPSGQPFDSGHHWSNDDGENKNKSLP